MGYEGTQYYRDLITHQYGKSARFIAWLDTALGVVDDATSLTLAMHEHFDIDTAAGAQLDTIGRIVGRSRVLPFEPTSASPVLDDATYRTLLRAKIGINHWNGQLASLQQLWQVLFPDRYVVVIDNQNMTLNIICIGAWSNLEKEIIEHDLIVPRPQGVLINYVFGAAFGYDLDTELIKGYDQGNWSR